MPLRHNHIDLLIPAHNEAPGIERSLDSSFLGIQELDNVTVDMTVIANGCTDDTIDIAEAWGEKNIPAFGSLRFRVLQLAEGHKIRGLNAGLAEATGDITLAMDADVTLDAFAMSGLVRILSTKKPLGASLYHVANQDFLPDGQLGDVIRMADLRRQAIPKRLKLHGGFMGWNSYAQPNNKPVEFPCEGAVSDDTWLSYALIAEHGPEAVYSANCGIFSRYIPPRTEADYIRQHSRYAIADEMVGRHFPHLLPAITAAQRAIPSAGEVTPEWRRLCAQHSINFDASIGTYDRIREEIAKDKQRAIGELLLHDGQWQPVATARITAV
jgi:glycosyltransferase involved in cell wall biosynthesis